MTDIKPSWQPKLLWIVFGIYAAAVLFGVTTHEPWRDESQSWLLVRDLDLAGLFKILPSEGHPPVWYLLVMPIAKLGLPYACQNWLAAIIILAGTYIILFKTDVHIAVKAILPFSYFFLYEYSEFARSYCVLVFFMACMISLYPKRFDKPWLFGLCLAGIFNTHMLAFSFAASVTGIYLLDAIQYKKLNKNVIGSLVMVGVLALYLIPYIVLPRTSGIYEEEVANHTKEITETFSYGLIASDNTGLAILLFIGLCIPLLNRTKPLLILTGGAAGVLYILGYKFMGGIRHCGVLMMVVFCVYAIADYYKNDPWNRNILKTDLVKYSPWLLVVVIAFQSQRAIASYIADKDRPYSDSKNVAEFLMANHLQNNILVGHTAAYSATVIPYLPGHKKFFYPECGYYGSFYKYDSCCVNKMWARPASYQVAVTREAFKGQLNQVILVFNHPVPADVAQQLDLIYYSQEPPIFEYEAFCLYKFKKEAQ